MTRGAIAAGIVGLVLATASSSSAQAPDPATDAGVAPSAETPPATSGEPPVATGDPAVSGTTSAAAASDPTTDGAGVIAPLGGETAQQTEAEVELEEFEDDGGGESFDRIFNTRIYGYIDAYWEYQTDEPNGIDAGGRTIVSPGEMSWDVLNLHVMAQGTILNRFRYFVNLASPGSGSPTEDEPLGVRNAWVEVPIVGNYLVVRAGKTYRRFGLYNEILDAVPTFIGIEPPEIFDRDHLLLTRTTNFMIHGALTFDEHTISYALTTGSDENSWNNSALPIGADVRYDLGTTLRVGTSFYHTGGFATPSRAPGEGSPRGGVVNWMDRDRYWVLGGYAQLQIEGFIFQAEYWHAQHSGFRNPESIRTMLDDPDSGITTFQRARFEDASGPMGVRERAIYGIDTFYMRTGYEIDAGEIGTITPYGQVDYYFNPEIIENRSYGGDNEAGDSDNGEFWKATLGLVFRPVPAVALKIDGSIHVFPETNAQLYVYPEARASFSYLWELEI